jgi:hypothetical protein
MAHPPPSVGKSFSESFSLFLRHFPVLAGLYFLAAIISITISVAIPFSTGYNQIINSGGDPASTFRSMYQFLSLLSVSQFMAFIVTTLVYALFIQYVFSIYQKERVSWKKLTIIGLKKLFFILLTYCAMFAVGIIGYIGVILISVIFMLIPVVGIFLLILGIIAFVILLILFLVRTSFAIYGIVLENLNPISALTRSFRLTKGFSGRIFLFYVIYALLISILFAVLFGLLYSFTSSTILVGVVSILVYGGIVFFQSWLETAKMTVFFQVKQFRENFGLEKLVSAFNEPENKAKDDGISGN